MKRDLTQQKVDRKRERREKETDRQKERERGGEKERVWRWIHAYVNLSNFFFYFLAYVDVSCCVL